MTAPWILDFLNRRAKVEQEMLDAAKRIGYSRPIDADQLRGWAERLGVPEDPEFWRAGPDFEKQQREAAYTERYHAAVALTAHPTDLRALLERCYRAIGPSSGPWVENHLQLLNDIGTALAEPAQEPVAWMIKSNLDALPAIRTGAFFVYAVEDPAWESGTHVPLYSAPPPASSSDARAKLTDTRLRQMIEDYRDAWSPGARDELFAQYKAEIATIERDGE